MITRWSAAVRTLRRWLSRSEWTVRLCRLPVSPKMPRRRGLVMIQIDGLSQRQLEQAIRLGRLPFLQRLIERDRYRLHSLYSGMPSSTPAVQGELFYGRKGIVPAFSFRDHQSGNVLRMYYPDSAAIVEERMEGEEGLLAGGSAYCDVFSGGACEAHFCASTVGWGGVLKALNPLAMGGLLLGHLGSFLRILTLLLIEFGLALVDCGRGLIAGRNLRKELTMVPARIGVCT